jgi:hypothetical protein
LERDPTTGATKRICTVPDTVPAEGYTAGGKFIGSQGCLCVPKPE